MQKRLDEQLGIKSNVVYPPVNIEKYKWNSQNNYYLSLGRLEPNKRVDRIVQAFINMPDKRLIVASGGSQIQKLKRMAAGSENISFINWSSEVDLVELIGNAIACIYIPQDEDFGMSAVESMSAGKPIIGVAEGGLLETVIDNHTGFLLSPNPTVEEICAAVKRMCPSVSLAMRSFCEARALKFSEERFVDHISSYI